MALLLGMESSCDETSAAVVEERNGILTVRSNIVASQIETHRLYGGVVPEIASRAHVEAVTNVTADALAEAGIKLTDLDAIAVTSHPGLIGALLVGVNFAKSLAFANRIPLVSVNHIHAHICAAFLTHTDLKPPFLALVVSGGHTCFYEVNEKMEYREIGGTRDDAAGEAFDKIGRVIGLPYPGGAALDKLAYEGNPKAISLPSPALGGEEIALSFSGIKTAALNYLNSAEQKGENVNRADLAASYTAKIVEAIVKKTDLALKQSGLKTLVLAGGVAANTHLRGALEILCKKKNIRLAMPSIALCGDNGAMVAAAGYFGYRAGCFSDTALNASALDYPEGIIGKAEKN
ncbi:MAG: tRNA (adenosine(37)-N6)-threonylcarbamoyltransferase complex transferase subunit TsaD [Ruminococcaceae bacterium]|nr:tRNA (adenosine(37)-N6)-threonylcarbamoyltransferase complex transferase subunit TsaD [Oscillospiraceae bacterium]